MINQVPKPKKVVDEDLLAYVSGMICLVNKCYRTNCDPAHLIKRSKHRLDVPGNVIPLCRIHHQIQENMDNDKFFEQYNISEQDLEEVKLFLERYIKERGKTG